MPEQSDSAPVADARRAERAARILDAAAALILRWGYDKTTIDDIARSAGVAKGTIYLHWKTREELFLALIERENAVWLEDFKQRVEADPAGGTLRGVMKHSALALSRRPLLKALLLRDADVMGKLARREQGSTLALEKVAGFRAYLDHLRERGLVRSDLSPRQEIYVLSAIFMGFFIMAPLMPEDMRLSEEEIADLIGETAHRTLESRHPESAEDLASAAGALDRYLERYQAAARGRLDEKLDA